MMFSPFFRPRAGRRPLTARRRLLIQLANAGLCLIALAPLVIAVAALSGMGHRWVDILAQFTGPALVSALGLALFSALLRLWPAAGFAALVSAVLLASGWPQWFPPKGEARPGAPVVTLYSANLLVRNRDVEAVRASIAEGEADLVVLIETPQAMLDQLDHILPDHPHRVVERGGAYAVDGTVIASRWPVVRRRALDGENHLAAEAQTPLGPLTVFAVHLTRPWPFQYQWGQIIQTMGLTEARQRVSGPLIMAGDFNAVSSARIGRQVRADMDLIPAPGWPGTWPAQLPSPLGLTIDHVYRSPDLALVDRRLGRQSGSDHRPVVARFTLAETPPQP
jgi:endonuclease/exonuclease/phosphatase (EEP) superfamily protein YafD